MERRTGNIALLSALFLTSFMALLCMSIVNVALPAMQADLSAEVADLQWIVNSYTLCLSSLVLGGGALGDRYGRRRVLAGGVLLFLVGSLVCALAGHIGVLIAGRVVQGVGAALLVPGTMAVLGHSFPDPAQRARVLGLWGLFGGMAPVVGPVLGGALVDHLGWPSIFLLNLPLGLLALVLVLRAVPESADPDQASLDPAGQLLAAAALAGLCYALIDAGQHGWHDTTWWLLAGSAVGIVAFLWVEHRQPHPMLPVRLFADRTFAATAGVSLLLGFGAYGAFVFLPMYLQQVQGHSAGRSGLELVPMTLAVVIASPLAGRLTARLGPRPPLALGYGCIALGLFGMVTLGPSTGYPLVGTLFATTGFGMGLVMTPASAAALASAPRQRSGAASAVVNAARQTGTALGVALLGALLTARAAAVGPLATPEETVLSGLHAAFLVAGLASAGAVAVALLVRGAPALRDPAPAGVPARHTTSTAPRHPMAGASRRG
ncbi:MAG TPA: MFS transporter [Pseudonocardiaceae bacterium]